MLTILIYLLAPWADTIVLGVPPIERFTDLVIPFPGDSFEYPDETIINYDASTTKPGQFVSSPSIAVGVKMDLIDVTGFILSDDYYSPTNSTEVTVRFTVSVPVTGINWLNATQTNLKICRYRTSEISYVTSNTISSPTTIGTLTATADIPIRTGDIVYVKFFSNSASSPTVTFTTTSAGTFTAEATPFVDVSNVDWNALWPEIEATELLQDFLTRFNIIMKQKDGTIYLKSLEDILGDRTNAVDWSAKLTKTIKPIDFTLPMAQTNYLSYNDQVNDEELGRGAMEISNTTLPVEKTIYNSPFENCIAFTSDDFTNMAEILVFDADSTGITDFSNSPGLKLCTLRDYDLLTEPPITFDVLARYDYKIAYFVDTTQTKDTGFQYFVDQFYPRYEGCLQKNKVIIKEYYLDELDIKNYDPHKIIYDGEGYYLVNKISNFVPNRITKVELFKIALAPVEGTANTSGDSILLETGAGNYVLQETSDHILIE